MAAPMRGVCINLSRQLTQCLVAAPRKCNKTLCLQQNSLASICRSFSVLSVDKQPPKTVSSLRTTSINEGLFKSKPNVALPANSSQVRTVRTKKIKPQVYKWRRDEAQKKYFNMITGEPTAVQLVLDRFYRLNNGMWIRTKAGRARRRWKKPNRRNWRALEHVTCNRTQCQTLDKMINEKWKKKNFFPDDPFNPYHRLDMLPIFRGKKLKPFYP